MYQLKLTSFEFSMIENPIEVNFVFAAAIILLILG